MIEQDPHDINKKVAVLLFNFGGPQSKYAVFPYLFRLFFDKNVINLHIIPRFCIALLISVLRIKKSLGIYKFLNFKSPIVDITYRQAIKLQEKLIDTSSYINEINFSWRVFVAMRYSKPFMQDVLRDISEYDPHTIILLPCYPHNSITTTGSFFDEFNKHEKYYYNSWLVKKVLNYHNNPLYTNAIFANIIASMNVAQNDISSFRFIFSAHGLPQEIVDKGDLYQKHIEETYKILYQKIEKKIGASIDSILCYQSRVGPKKWLTPYLDDTISQCVADKKNIILIPLSFISENSETLVELDIEVKEEAIKLGVKEYIRVRTVEISKEFIECLKDECIKCLRS